MIERYLAIDLGAGSGRVIIGELEDKKLRITPIHSFPNEMVNVLGTLHWDVLGIYREVLEGLRICARRCTTAPVSLAVDTWGLDFGLLDVQGNLIGAPVTYRDRRTQGVIEPFHKKISPERLHELTGLEIRRTYTLFQLYSMVLNGSPQLKIADALLFMPDIFNYFLSAVKKTEFTHASGSQLYNATRGVWDDEIFAALGLPKRLMQDIVPTGTVIGSLTDNITSQTGLKSIPVVAGATHDTSDAVAAVPASTRDFAYISSGTWSLMGIESPKPIISDKTFQYRIANQGAAWGDFLVLKNITGLWLLQECRREWAKTKDYAYADLVQMAESAKPAGAVIDPDHLDFFKPDSMSAAIANFCRKTGQPMPKDIGEVVRVILESLALAYRYTVEQLEDVRGRKIAQLNIVGGGSQNALLCQFAADATGLPVYAGPVEATAIGSVLIQARALGRIASHEELREVVHRSFSLDTYQPKPTAYWDRAYGQFKKLKQG